MTDQKRDESRDCWVHCPNGKPGFTQLGTRFDGKPASDYVSATSQKPNETYHRYVPHADLVASEYLANDIAKDCHAMAQEIEHEHAILNDIKSWASEEINELRSKLEDSDRARKSAEFYLSIHSADSQRAHTELLDARVAIAEQKARIDAVNALLSEHGCHCECACAPGEHETKCTEHDETECTDDCPIECDVCFACRVQAALSCDN